MVEGCLNECFCLRGAVALGDQFYCGYGRGSVLRYCANVELFLIIVSGFRRMLEGFGRDLMMFHALYFRFELRTFGFGFAFFKFE